MICDQLEEHLLDQRICERLLMYSTLTLEKAISAATQSEVAMDQAKAFCEPLVAPVHAVQPASCCRWKNVSGKRSSAPSRVLG